MSIITMKKIAEKAGISQPAVSNILNNKKSFVSQATRERVLKIAQELNYRPNYFARSLKKGRTNCIGLMGSLKMIDLSAYCYTQTAQAVEEALSETKSKYSLVIFGANFTDTHEKSLELVERGMVDGLILVIFSPFLRQFETGLMPRLVRGNLPFVVVHSTSRKLAYPNVGFNSHQAGYLAAEHFVRLGYGEITYFLRDRTNPQLLETLAGFKQALIDCRMEWTDQRNLIQPQGGAGHHLINTFGELPRLPRAVFFPDEVDAYGMLNFCRTRNVRVPEEVAVIGFDDEKPAVYFQTDLTTIHHSFEEKGHTAVRMLTAMLEGRLEPNAAHQEIIQPRLVVRKTCGAQ
jgi:DNA-binding LacI/PurR family transcriptional regulator